MYFFVVQIRRRSFISPVKFIAAYFIHHSNQQFFFTTKGDTHTIRSIIMDKIGGSVQRVYQPAIVFRSQAARTSFGNESCFGKQFPKLSHNTAFRFFIYIRYIVVSIFLLYLATVKTATLFTKKNTRPECYFTYFQRYLL